MPAIISTSVSSGFVRNAGEYAVADFVVTPLMLLMLNGTGVSTVQQHIPSSRFAASSPQTFFPRVKGHWNHKSSSVNKPCNDTPPRLTLQRA